MALPKVVHIYGCVHGPGKESVDDLVVLSDELTQAELNELDLHGVPLTIDHPPRNVPVSQCPNLVCGRITHATRAVEGGGKYVFASFRTDTPAGQEAFRRLQAGELGLSMGHIYEENRYRGTGELHSRVITGDHVALCAKPRREGCWIGISGYETPQANLKHAGDISPMPAAAASGASLQPAGHTPAAPLPSSTMNAFQVPATGQPVQQPVQAQQPAQTQATQQPVQQGGVAAPAQAQAQAQAPAQADAPQQPQQAQQPHSWVPPQTQQALLEAADRINALEEANRAGSAELEQARARAIAADTKAQLIEKQFNEFQQKQAEERKASLIASRNKINASLKRMREAGMAIDDVDDDALAQTFGSAAGMAMLDKFTAISCAAADQEEYIRLNEEWRRQYQDGLAPPPKRRMTMSNYASQQPAPAAASAPTSSTTARAAYNPRAFSLGATTGQGTGYLQQLVEQAKAKRAATGPMYPEGFNPAGMF